MAIDNGHWVLLACTADPQQRLLPPLVRGLFGGSPARPGMPGLLRQLPTRLYLKIGQEPGHQRRSTPARLHPSEAAHETPEHPGHDPLPGTRIYAVACGHRQI
uniref:hypothetical protein n=1 Tax=Micromonospora yasonensis TaxID=1128667 RepID=UPI003873A8DD